MTTLSKTEFDFIVGAGTAGNVVSGRLAEALDVSVLVIEPGIGNPSTIPETTSQPEPSRLVAQKNIINRPEYERVEEPKTRNKALGGSCLNYYTWVPAKLEEIQEYIKKCTIHHDDDGLFLKEPEKIGSPEGNLHMSHSELISE